MDATILWKDYLPNTSICLFLLLTLTALYFELTYRTSQYQNKTKNSSPNKPNGLQPTLTTLQKHVLFWDRDNNSIIYPRDIYIGFRTLGFNIPFSLSSLLIPIFFSYPTRLSQSLIPDPFFRIYIHGIHKAKHGSDTGIYDLSGNLRDEFFEGLFREFDVERRDSLSAGELWRMVKRNRVAADVAGWSFAMMEWGTTWLLLQRDGRMEKADLKACYDGSVFWEIGDEVSKGSVRRGYGLKEFGRDVVGTWRGPKKME